MLFPMHLNKSLATGTVSECRKNCGQIIAMGELSDIEPPCMHWAATYLIRFILSILRTYISRAVLRQRRLRAHLHVSVGWPGRVHVQHLGPVPTQTPNRWTHWDRFSALTEAKANFRLSRLNL